MDAIVEHAHFMVIMDHTGHTTITWDPDDKDSVKEAKKEFKKLLNEGYQAFEMSVERESGGMVTETKGTRATEFDPTVGKYMMIPHLQGG